MKKAWKIVSVIAMVSALAFVAEAKSSKQTSRALMQQCKQENPTAKKKELRKCVKSKSRLQAKK